MAREKWWAVRSGRGEIIAVEFYRAVAVRIASKRGTVEMVEVCPVFQDKCEWETRMATYSLTNFDELLTRGMKFCPNCGRSLEVPHEVNGSDQRSDEGPR